MMLFPIAVGRWPQVAAFAVGAGGADVTAPVLSSPTDTSAGATTATLAVTTDEGNGTLYWVVTTSSTPPSAAQVKAGQDHASAAAPDSGSQAVSGTGVQNASANGLTPSTAYFAHFMHEDAATNQSSVASGDGFTTSASSTPTFVAAGTALSASIGGSPGLPSGTAEDDILLLLIETANEAIAAPDGTWGAVDNSPSSTSGASTASRITAYWKSAGSGEVAPTLADPGDHIHAVILGFRGCPTSGDPWNVTAAGTVNATNSVSIPAVTTTLANCLIVNILSIGGDFSGADRVDSFTNAGLTSLTERYDAGTNIGNGGALAVATGIKATAGNTGATVAAIDTSSDFAMLTIALKSA
jgi:hypothetical protein